MSKRNIVSAVAVIVLLLIVGYFTVFYEDNSNNYSVVYLSTGEVYVGKLTTSPDLQLKDSYILQVTKDAKDPNKNNFQLQPISEALWAPKTLHLIKDNVVFYGPILPSSKIGEALANKGK